ncbi:hypothetical protein C349_03696 [Cryptococcus neoformans var. grubii Br795]|uniref:Uncharacterized protein n=1 Tax=Cryptococcus neoformans (strain H99 / ATCC 208821 / CBS 10515 / FGSC 9487) TaxID=235443 RepID=J9VMF0_CRYN9|nr:hypothetical protein CNAG_02163 [Cryptococcus neoformans var. grubii H99]AUB25489.1 hypothetical protein CKF44_02163 [Cryptococcus neoformans var. grubii]OWZ40954.1 hypothetical protein C353_03671 [Cryptococcus neoformans var. grubii AD1-83a]OXG57926.1 hypothetical protein C354_03606 [Cryptococcus neoformans var. grubii MW-RSA1955]OXG62520.1 hypothetical protein C352_03618 [Cryptococcus neoformans var. grubii CHC193]OXG62699.1 hypothetical protein C351_03393 [Cryptococcus neoformans var. gr|eukprot:XP_012049986.1 hypothetical protein CNAG_02163 [Cryptococcus neoformans var. grubii H99]
MSAQEHMPPPTLKRARPHSTNPSSSSATPTAAQPTASSALPGPHTTSRAKRRKPEPASVEKEREKETEGEIKTKIDFNDLPVETLYKYLEAHDLLPRWEPSPWSEEPCIPPNQLYMIPPAAPTPVPPTSVFPTNHDPSPPLERTPSMAPGAEEDVKPTMSTVDIGVEELAAVDTGDAPNGAADDTTFTSGEKTDGAQQTNGTEEAHQSANGQVEEGETTTAALSGQGETTAEEPNGPRISDDLPTAPVEPTIDPDPNAPSDIPPTADAPPPSPHSTPPPPTPPTTRSKTLPSRRPATPPPPSPPPPIRRGVMTLSDVLAAKHVLAEKANAHWAKGLGGGQNKESETIVNFLYKMKVGPGRLLRVYNPMTSAQQPWL